MIRICLCDDDPFWLEMMEIRIKKCIAHAEDEYEFTSCSTLKQLKEKLENQEVDILFLDIVLGETNTADWLSEKTDFNMPEVIFMTAFPEEAYSISEVDHTYFLVKSRLTDDMIAGALNRAENSIVRKNGEAAIFRVGGESITVKYSDILFFESFGNYLKIHLKNGDVFDSRSTLKEFKKTMPKCFLRCHRSYAVNMDHIKGYGYSRFIMDDSCEVQIPPKKYAGVVEEYSKYIKSRKNLS